jgi:[CysO sulfur-carrier protein]-S-L-cysteine hydrolase
MKTTEKLPAGLEQLLVKSACRALPREICGFVLGDAAGWFVMNITNLSPKDTGFIMDEGELLNVYRNYRDQMVGIFHSHPSGDAKPSFDDAMYAPGNLRYWIITEFGASEWDMNNGEPKEITAWDLADPDPAYHSAQ